MERCGVCCFFLNVSSIVTEIKSKEGKENARIDMMQIEKHFNRILFFILLTMSKRA